jgi:hypothetical protein
MVNPVRSKTPEVCTLHLAGFSNGVNLKNLAACYAGHKVKEESIRMTFD